MTWDERAACKGKPVSMFIDSDAGRYICRDCPVKAECLAEANQIERDTGRTVYGLWGGMDEVERHRLDPRGRAPWIRARRAVGA